ncbi:hypothetical protein DPSP01_007819 [Paraphaeosphaeria sporulosa]|uniref:Prion-inhibition and propagation HeLo domain-containing protein n=1 Tax=Paraphaeosphaeria sporulosa TaxID=1460663 RepID=A0A177CJG0_9PLEO|nr:uncharacterized protein CC84DRAFT_1204929 [Paraphaeosphaeria sporulosa]OAG07446.1 hypothetical protein CC84DRAFT_1204929 [Paraphaeosphaeria sporulosa]
MSGLEVAGVFLGAFPLLISSIEHWQNVAKVGGYFCGFPQKQLMDDPDGDSWKNSDLQGRLKLRLQESFKTYMEIVAQMQETAEELKNELCFQPKVIQGKLTPSYGTNERSPSPGKLDRTVVTKATFDYQMFRVKFSLRDTIREGLFAQLQECNERLEKLLVTSSQIPDKQNSQPASFKQISTIETALSVAHK